MLKIIILIAALTASIAGCGSQSHDISNLKLQSPGLRVQAANTIIRLFVNGKKANVAPKILNGVTFVPVRAAGELLNKFVSWDTVIKAVYINNQKHDKVMYFPEGRYPQTAAHMKSAIGRGKLPICTIDRSGADENREEALKDIPTKEGYDRDEFPMAMCSEGGPGSDVAYVISSDNQGAGAWIGNNLENYPNGTRVLFVIDGTIGDITKPTPTQKPATTPKPVYYQNCAAVKAAGKAPLRKGDPGYSTNLDRDGDGVACEN